MAAAARVMMAERTLDTAAVHAEHADFVWKTLQRFQIRPGDLEDVFQEVFIVVHRRLATYDETARMTTWLYGICRRVASGYRRRAFRRREEPRDEVGSASAEGTTPEDDTARNEALRRLSTMLDELSLEQRAVLTMFEIESMPCSEIAEVMGVPVGTVHSRLHAARKAFESALQRLRAREAGP